MVWWVGAGCAAVLGKVSGCCRLASAHPPIALFLLHCIAGTPPHTPLHPPLLPAVRKEKTKKEPVKFSWLYDRPLELHYNEMSTARTRGTGAHA